MLFHIFLTLFNKLLVLLNMFWSYYYALLVLLYRFLVLSMQIFGLII